MISDITFHRENVQDGTWYYDVLVPGHKELISIGNIYLLYASHKNPRHKAGQWMYEQEDSCCSLSAQDLLLIANKLMDLTLEKEGLENVSI